MVSSRAQSILDNNCTTRALHAQKKPQGFTLGFFFYYVYEQSFL